MLVIVPTVFEAVHLFGEAVRAPLLADGSVTISRDDFGADATIVPVVDGGRAGVPPNQEAPHASPTRHDVWHVTTCGFGLAASGVGALASMFAHGAALGGGTLRRAVLVGISGTFDSERVPVGTALVGTDVMCEGIGAGTGVGYVSAATMGWLQGHARSWLPAAGDRVPLVVPSSLAGLVSGPILSVAAASGDGAHRDDRAARHPDALVEEMEGYAVALAARLCRVELTIVRGVSDLVGDRNPANWEVAKAMVTVRAALSALAEDPTWHP
jgi:futalosine hydrolase